jgi:hypothetical protein
MKKTKAITKKLKDEIFIWDPTAYSNKGYWYVLGTTGAFGRPASKAENIKLGKPPKPETEPVSPQVINDSDVAKEPTKAKSDEYRKSKKVGNKSLKELAFKKYFDEGESLGSALKSSISDKFKAKVSNIKEKFDPLNIAKNVFGNKIAAVIGRKMGRDEKDIKYFTGYGNKKAKQVGETSTKIGKVGDDNLEEALHTKVSSGNKTKVRTKESVTDILAKLYNLIKNHHDEEIKENKLHKKDQEKFEELKNTWNKELIQALTGKEEEPTIKVKEFNKFISDLTDKLEEMADAISATASGMSIADFGKKGAKKRLGKALLSGAANLFGRVVLAAASNPLTWVAGAFALPFIGAGIELAEIKKDPNNPKYKFNPYAMVERGEAKDIGEAEKINRERGLKLVGPKEVQDAIESKLTDEELVKEYGYTRDSLKKFAGENPKASLQVVPEKLRAEVKKEIAVPTQTQQSSESSSSQSKSSNNTASQVSTKDDKSLDESQKDVGKQTVSVASSNETQGSTPSIQESPTATEETTTQLAGMDSKISPEIESTLASEMPTTPKYDITSTIGENVDLTNNENMNYGSSIIADNSQKINIINQNNDGLLVEELTSVRLEEYTINKIQRQYLHYV